MQSNLLGTEKRPGMSFATLLQQGYIDWLAKRGKYGSQADFAMELGVSPIAFNRHYNGRTEPPHDDPSVEKYAAYFGDAVYDELGLARKNSLFREFSKRYDETPIAQFPRRKLHKRR